MSPQLSATPTAHEVHRSWLSIFAQVIAIASALAPAAAAPFVSAAVETKISDESALAGKLSSGLSTGPQ